MRNRIIVTLAFTALAVGFTSPAQADQPKIGTYLVGDWSMAGQIDGEKFTGKMAVGRLADGQSLLYEWSGKVNGIVTQGTLLGGIDPGSGKVVEHAFAESNHFTNTYDKVLEDELGKATGKRVGTVNGKPFAGDIVVDRTSHDRFTYTVSSNGNVTVHFVFERIGKVGPDYETLKAMEFFIGDWEATTTVQEDGLDLGDLYQPGATENRYETWYWIEDKNYIGVKFGGEIDGKEAHTGFEMVGVDPKSGKVVHWLFSKLGGSGTGTWKIGPKELRLNWNYRTAAGNFLKGVAYHKVVDEDTYTWQIRDMTEDGKKLADTPVVTLHRVKK
ncbi:hypothetical protein [Novipirellula artificiosorum]|uniref:Uncharacterized protein n=1 Tax=Novipirellula artificiosorum TaxID=2528016 RepID=A0A5C6DWM1_9BACT|nr:hypothetical protein [Novipirellula artificiosorum]TWU41022.1 hypothetical protein Poly41_18570 [Novipirellula artificiosorum]